MRTRNILIAALLATMLLPTGCTKREGVPQTKNRLMKTVTGEQRLMDGSEYYAIAPTLDEEWLWDGKEVFSILHHTYGNFAENFYYGKHHQIVRSEVPAFNIRSEWSYDGRLLKEIRLFTNDGLTIVNEYKHNDDNKISEIEQTIYATTIGPQTDITLHAAHTGLAEVSQLTNAMAMQAIRSAAKGKTTVNIIYQFTWDGDNISHVSVSNHEIGYELELTYDNRMNPYTQIYNYSAASTGSPYQLIAPMSIHNVRTIHCKPAIYNVDTYYFDYNYNGDDFPSERRYYYTYRTIVDPLADTVTIKVIKTTTYTYE